MEKVQCPCCGCLTLGRKRAWEICHVCFWEDEGGIYKDGVPDIKAPSEPNGGLTIEQARENLRQLGACSEKMVKNTRKPSEEEITDEYRSIMRAGDSWIKELISELDISGFFLVVNSSKNSYQADIYTEKDGAVCTYTGWMQGADSLHKRYFERFGVFMLEPGIHLWRCEFGSIAEQRYFPEREYNSVLYDGYGVYAMFWDKYRLLPPGENGRERLEKIVRDSEKMRSSLVYACYIGDTEQIIQRAKNARPAQLNKAIPYMNTPLGFCAQNNDLAGFKAVAAAGADLGKQVAAMTPLSWAMIYSPDIAEYIFEHHRRQFDSELEKQGTRLFAQAADERVFALADRCGFDLSPLAFDFAKTNNTAGMLHLINGGTDVLNMKDTYGHTPLYYAERNGERTEAVREMIRALEERENNEKTSLSP